MHIFQVMQQIEPRQPSLIALYGSDPEELAAQVSRARALIQRFMKVFPDLSDVTLFSSPGRTEVGGNHTDHNAGRVLAAAVNLDVLSVCAPTANNTIQIDSQGYPRIIVSLDNLEIVPQEKGSPAALVRGIAARLKELGYTIGGFSACFTSSVPNGSGLSSSAAFEMMIAAVLNHLYNQGSVTPILAAQIGQYAENNYFGKPCGLMDQTTCAVGGFVTIDFQDSAHPIVHKVDFDFAATGYSLAIIGAGGSHADLTDEYAAITREMKSVAAFLGGNLLREFSARQVLSAIPEMRGQVSDRAILRALHFYADNDRVVAQVDALERGDFKAFLHLVIESGDSSWKLNQNIYSIQNPHEQGLAIALAVSESILRGAGAWRVHGGGFAGTIQAFVPHDLVSAYMSQMGAIFGPEHCYLVSTRAQGATPIHLA